MSEWVKITIVTGDEKSNRENLTEKGKSTVVTHEVSATLMSTLLKEGLLRGSLCGGRGSCGRCEVRFLKGMTIPTPIERSKFSPDELRQGYRLACMARPKDDCVIKIVLEEEAPIAILTDAIEMSANSDYISQLKKRTKNREANVTEHAYLVAVDLGTTTIAMKLISMDPDRKTVDIYCEKNPQRCYGADVLSRIQASSNGHRTELQKMVQEVLERGLAQFRDTLFRQGIRNKGEKRSANNVDSQEDCITDVIACICISGNTTMEHLFMGYDVSSLGVSPFTPVEIGIQGYEFSGLPVYLTPGISAFVGGDIVAGLYALGLFDGVGAKDEAFDMEAILFIDLGTNGEMAITDGKRMIVTAAAAGPAFEGGVGSGVTGTDMIAVTARLLRQGILDETGLMREPYFTEGVSYKAEKTVIRLQNKDIRALQMAKAAVRAGVEILWEQMGRIPINKAYLAGGFGYYLDVESAFQIGLLPERLRGAVEAVGNTSLEGAYRMGRDLYEGRLDKGKLARWLASAESINLAEQTDFERLYLQYMNLEPCQ